MASATPSYVSSKETTNFARLCRLLVDVGSQALRDKFDSIHPPAGLHGILKKPPAHTALEALRKKRILNPTQWAKLYPPDPLTLSSNNFDVTLLMLLLRKICGLTAPATGWDNLPPAGDPSVEANIARVKYYRNHVYGHANQASVDDLAFNSYWQEISTALVGLGADAAAICKLKTESMDPTIEKHYQELLTEWKKDDDSTKEILDEIEDQLKQTLESQVNISQQLESLMDSVESNQSREKDDLEQIKSELGNISGKLQTVLVESPREELRDKAVTPARPARKKICNIVKTCREIGRSFKERLLGAVTPARPKKPKNPTNSVDGGPSPNIDSPLPAGSDIANEPFDLERCKAQLCTHYNSTMSQVRITPWDDDNTVDIDAVYTTLSWTRDVRTPSGTIKRDLDDYTDIFKGDERIENPKRILVYGRPGIGKSTFSQKLAVDWANRRKENLERFELFLLIKLRDVGISQDLPAILNASKLLAADGSTSSESLYEFVLHNQEKVLLVFDGFDEYGGGKKSPVHEIWKGEQLRDCCVIITTREMEGGELMKVTPFQFEIRGFLKKEQIVSFASRFITAQEEVEEFYYYLDKRNLRGLAEIPLLLLMLSLIWRNRDCKELPVSQLGLHERFVQTLLHHMDTNDLDNGREKKTQEEETENEKQSENVLVKYKYELTVIGRMALEALLLQSAPHIDLNEVNVESGGLTYKMIRSGLFQFSKLAVADPTKRIFFLHKSIQEYLAARYIMNEAALEEIDGKFTGIDSFDKGFRLSHILRFMCEWSQEGAMAVFTLLEFLGKKENLSKCSLSKTPCIYDLSRDQRLFRDVCLGCLLSCSVSFRQDLFHSFLSCVDDVVTVNDSNRKKLAAECLPRSGGSPGYVFFQGSNLPLSVLADLKARVVTPRGLELNAHALVERYVLSSLYPEHFFLINEGGQFYLYFATILRKERNRYDEMLLELTRTECRSLSAQNCFSLVRDFAFFFRRKEQLMFLFDLLPCVSCPKSVIISDSKEKNFTDPELEKSVISKINVTDNLYRLNLSGLDVTNEDVAKLHLPSGCEVVYR